MPCWVWGEARPARPRSPLGSGPSQCNFAVSPSGGVHVPQPRSGPALCPALTIRTWGGMPHELLAQISGASTTLLSLGSPEAAATEAIGLAGWRARDGGGGRGPSTAVSWQPRQAYSRHAGRLPSRSVQRHQRQVMWLSEGEEAGPRPLPVPRRATQYTLSSRCVTRSPKLSSEGGTAPKTTCPSPHPQHLNATLFGRSLC